MKAIKKLIQETKSQHLYLHVINKCDFEVLIQAAKIELERIEEFIDLVHSEAALLREEKYDNRHE